MEESLLALFRNDPAVNSILGSRIDWVRRPQEDTVFPAATMHRTGGNRQYHTIAPDGLVETGVQIDVWAEKYSSAKLAARAVMSVINGYRTGEFQGIFIEAERDLPDESLDGNNRLYRVSIDLIVWHTE